MNNKVALEIRSISCSQDRTGAYALVLGEINGNRNILLIIGATEAQAILIEQKGIAPSRPLTHHLFASVLKVLGIQMLRTLIYKVENGVYYSYLFLKAGENILRVDARPSDSIALALCMQAPILIDEELLNTEHLKEEFYNPYQWEYTDDPEILKAALQRAIDLEDYEEAAILRDKLNKQS